MGLSPAGFAERLEPGPGARAVLTPDQAGRHGGRAPRVPGNATPLPLPPHSPEPDPVGRVRLHLRERLLPHRVPDGYEAVLDAARRARNALVAETGRLAGLAAYPYLPRSELP